MKLVVQPSRAAHPKQVMPHRETTAPTLDARRQVIRDGVGCPTCLVPPGRHCLRERRHTYVERLQLHAERWEFFELMYDYMPIRDERYRYQ